MAKAVYVGYSTVGNNDLDTHIYDVELVKQDLRNQFFTRFQERRMRPGFGCLIWDLLGDPFDQRTESLIINEVRRIIATDPRVRPLSINVQASVENHSIQVSVSLQYIELGRQEFLNLVFT